MLGEFWHALFFLGIRAIRELSRISLYPARGLFYLRLRLGLVDIMESGDSNDISVVDSIESKGGLKFEVIYAEPTSPPPSKTTTPLSPKSIASVENINNKLKAATDRRRTIEAVKHQQFEEMEKRKEEVMQKKEEQNENFKQQSKAQLEQKIMSATEAREAQITALLERLQEHDKHIQDVRRQMNEQTDQLRERLEKKLEQAQEKRKTMLYDLQVKQTEHLARVEEIRQLKGLSDAQNENQVATENVTLSG